jgi:hypothetical protein
MFCSQDANNAEDFREKYPPVLFITVDRNFGTFALGITALIYSAQDLFAAIITESSTLSVQNQTRMAPV